MDVSPNEAEQALADIERLTQKTRHSFAESGAYVTLFFTGIVWLVGFVATQFLAGAIVAYVWVGMSFVCTVLAVFTGRRMGGRFRSPSTTVYARRLGLHWLMLALFAIAVILVARPADGKQITLLIVLFTLLGHLSMGLVLSFSATWWALPIAVLALAGYFLAPAYFYLWMGVLVGGGMIALALYIRSRW
jgi:hypothetical protein